MPAECENHLDPGQDVSIRNMYQVQPGFTLVTVILTPHVVPTVQQSLPANHTVLRDIHTALCDAQVFEDTDRHQFMYNGMHNRFTSYRQQVTQHRNSPIWL